MGTYNIADLFEGVAAAVPDREALVLGAGGQATERFSYDELARRVDRAAQVMVSIGVGPGDHVGLHLHNGLEYLECMLALYALRAVPVNVNYRYVADELAYLFADADLVAVVTEAGMADAVETARVGAPALAQVLVVGGDYEDRLATAPDGRPDVGPRSSDDLYLLYTGGTTGMPKGVMWRHEDIYFASLGGRGTPSAGIGPLEDPDAIGTRARRGDPIMRRLPLCPLMHGGAMWVGLQTLLSGGALVIATDRHFDAAAALGLLAGERVELTMLIGDATARPLTDELAAHPDRYDLSALRVIASGGAIMSASVKAAFAQLVPGAKVVDTFGASETGGQGRLRAGPDGRPRLLTDEHTAVFDDEWHRVEPGDGVVGRLARSRWVPFGYYKDPDKTAATFPVIDGVRWSVPGDLARVETDGSITVLGRGAMCINTGGEKVFPEEVESALKHHPDVFDALVVGLADERFGQRVVGVVALREGAALDDDELTAHAHEHLAGYKVPRAWVRTDHVERSPVGKPDYAWAREIAEQALGTPS